jgi:hypothetical protein
MPATWMWRTGEFASLTRPASDMNPGQPALSVQMWVEREGQLRRGGH